MLPGCLRRKSKYKWRVSHHTARHSKEAAGSAKRWSVGRLAGCLGLQADVLVLVLVLEPQLPRSIQPRSMGSRHLSQQDVCLKASICLLMARLGMCSVTECA
jgi:hypothetical protein